MAKTMANERRRKKESVRVIRDEGSEGGNFVVRSFLFRRALGQPHQ